MSFTHPLKWPEGWPRQKATKVAAFATSEMVYRDGAPSYRQTKDITMAEAVKRLNYELERLNVSPDDRMVSTNMRVNLSGLPRGDQGEPGDPGVAVYFQQAGKPMRVLAIDIYGRVRDNIAAIAATLEAMRKIERHGGARIMERAFTGFTAIAHDSFDPWKELGLKPGALPSEIEAAFRAKAKTVHPDAPGGSVEAFQRLERARREAIREQAHAG